MEHILLFFSEVYLQPDLRQALVYVSPLAVTADSELPTDAERKAVLKGLKSASQFIYERLKKRLVMKRIPAIKFEYDVRYIKASQIWGLMSTVK